MPRDFQVLILVIRDASHAQISTPETKTKRRLVKIKVYPMLNKLKSSSKTKLNLMMSAAFQRQTLPHQILCCMKMKRKQ
jgi:hypothetical protein